jgi:plasmid rolling circle replication initiator protein Rep
MLKFDNKFLEEMQDKLKVNVSHSNYYFHLHKDFNEPNYGKFYKKSIRIRDCLNYWKWNVYNENKLMDLIEVSRCGDNKWCPNCRTLNVAINIHNFEPAFKEMLSLGYCPYLFTLTVPNVKGSELKLTIDKMIQSYKKLWEWLYRPIGKGYKGYSGRLVNFRACIRMLEINIQHDDHGMYHPHFHCMIFCEELSEELIDKHIDGGYQRRTQQVMYYSWLDLHLMILWKLAYDDTKLTDINYKQLEDYFEENYIQMQNDLSYKHPLHTWCGLYLCDFKQMTMPGGIYEIFKYSFKDKEIYCYQNFKDLYFALENRRLKQGHGELYRLKLDEDNGDKQLLEEFLQKEESPQELIHKEINILTTIYHDYNKISRFKAYKDLDKIIDTNN